MSIVSSLADFGFTLITFASRVKRVEKKTDEIEKNYLSRFQGVRDDIANNQLAVFEKIDRMHLDIVDRMNKTK